MTNETAESLGDKLGGLDLNEDEASMLLALLGVEAKDEVAGFGFVDYAPKHRLLVAAPIGARIGLGASSLQECTISK